MDAQFLERLACSQCGGKLRNTKEEVLVCLPCRLCFPIVHGAPNLNMEAAMGVSPEARVVARNKIALFTVESGLDAGVSMKLEAGQCRAIGRTIQDLQQTQIIQHTESNMPLDDQTKKIIKNYFSKNRSQKTDAEVTELGTFKRVADLALSDPGVSRLHTMIFYDAYGAGIIDLVSRNGTFVNGKEVENAMLQPGDEVTLGETKIRFTLA